MLLHYIHTVGKLAPASLSYELSMCQFLLGVGIMSPAFMGFAEDGMHSLALLPLQIYRLAGPRLIGIHVTKAVGC